MHHPPAPRRDPRSAPTRTLPMPAGREPFTPVPDDVDVVGITEAATMLGISRQRIHQYVADGRLVTAKRDGERWTIARAEIDWLRN